MAGSDWADFKLRELRLDEQNFRTGPVQGQRGAILAIIDEQKRKLANLGRDILEMGAVSPGEPIWVTRDLENAGKYIVLEGNRRVCALMLLDNPTLADGTVVERAFKELSRQFTATPIRELEARIFASREAAWPGSYVAIYGLARELDWSAGPFWRKRAPIVLWGERPNRFSPSTPS